MPIEHGLKLPKHGAQIDVIGIELDIDIHLHRPGGLKALDSIFERAQRGGVPWISWEVAHQLADLTVGTASARCSFGSSLHVLLHLALLSEERGIAIDLSFTDMTNDVCEVASLCAAVLEINLSVFPGLPSERLDGVRADTELAFPPFGLKLQQGMELPKRTMDWMGGGSQGQTGCPRSFKGVSSKTAPSNVKMPPDDDRHQHSGISLVNER